MKNLFKFFTFSAAVLSSLISCEKEDNNATASSTRTVEIIAGAPTTKTHSDKTLQIKWDETEASMAVIQYTDDRGYYHRYVSEIPSVDENGETATFTSTVITPFLKTWGVYPASACVKQEVGDLGTFIDASAFEIELPSSQTPDKVNGIFTFDPQADLLISAPVTEIADDKSIQMQFSRPLALVELNLTPERTDGVVVTENVRKIIFSSKAPLAGKAIVNLNESLDLDGQNISYTLVTDDSKQTEIELDLSNSGLVAEAGKTVTTQFMAFPGDLDSFALTVYTDKNVYTKSYSGTSLRLKANTKLTLKLTLDPSTKIERKFKKLTKASDLQPGDEVIFVDEGYAMGEEISVKGQTFRKAVKVNKNISEHLSEIAIFKLVDTKQTYGSVYLQDMTTKRFLCGTHETHELKLENVGKEWFFYNYLSNDRFWVTDDYQAGSTKWNAWVICRDADSKHFKIIEQKYEDVNTQVYYRRVSKPLIKL